MGLSPIRNRKARRRIILSVGLILSKNRLSHGPRPEPEQEGLEQVVRQVKHACQVSQTPIDLILVVSGAVATKGEKLSGFAVAGNASCGGKTSPASFRYRPAPRRADRSGDGRIRTRSISRSPVSEDGVGCASRSLAYFVTGEQIERRTTVVPLRPSRPLCGNWARAPSSRSNVGTNVVQQLPHG